MKLLFPKHFQYRMTERGIDIDHVKQAMKHADFTEPTFSGRMIARKKIDELRTIEVVYYKQGFKGANDFVIITAYYVSTE